ncbi:endonuclease MutS2 [Paenibacillus protaetiae]|uniref:DNA mismatch repair protein MutS n=1 Tax=Paenibacillus protaetiae TaxID=2509456 RepID=A0A4P6EWC4_9BACL|nr:DNA mismatch repair protein MutS [Paenibacillus protaetiae]QAY66029.1 DNA mismatch repair protein MutS [Paenibacillus protaetiae]
MNGMESAFKQLEFNRVMEKLLEYTVSPAGRDLAERHQPSDELKRVRIWQQETKEAAALLAAGASIPLSAMEGIDSFMALLGKGRIYAETELEQLAVWLSSVAQMKKYMDSKRLTAPTIASYADSMVECRDLKEELVRCIRYGRLTDGASPYLADIRRHIYAAEQRIEKKMEQTLTKYRTALQEQLVSKRRGRLVIPVKRELRKQVPGTVWDESSSGQTLFVEPADVAELQNALQQLLADEERERTVILSELSGLAESYAPQLHCNLEAMASFDFIMARGKLGRSYGGISPLLSAQPEIRIVGGRHPLLRQEAVPLHVELGTGWNQLIITGPNTGGKTVALKTIGLLVLMAQAGLLVPAEEGTELGLFRHVMADVGDGQSLEQSLSTFSSHLAAIKAMLENAGPRSLFLLDELAAGTDPSEGIALSVALLEELLASGSLTAASTHFNEIKAYASRTPGCQNARMAFDPETLQPLYRLEVGAAGESHAFVIARRVGLPAGLMNRAEQLLAAAVKPGTAAGTAEKDAAGKFGAAAECPGAGEGVEQPDAKAEGAAASAANGAEAAPHAGSAGWRKLSAAERSERGSKAAPSPRGKPPEFAKGDAVWIYPLNRAGIVYRPADERGNVMVQVEGRKLHFNRKRLKPYIAKEKLYPGADYDMDIVFDSKENRKARKLMSRKHVEGLSIISPPEP